MRFLVLLLLVLFGGCSLLKSRYAMDDPVYAEKYAEGAEQGDVLGKAKQMIDARHTDGLGGFYVGGGAQVLPESGTPLFGGELGFERYPSNSFSHRLSCTTYLGNDDGFAGFDLGARLQTPSRVAPFAGLGGFIGLSPTWTPAETDGIDNDDNGWVDEPGETDFGIDGLLGIVYPEVGAHLWINGCWRVTTYARYLFTTEGRAQDDWLAGAQLTAFQR
jgi:hypothetical protein